MINVEFECEDGVIRDTYMNYTELCPIGESMRFEGMDGEMYFGRRLPPRPSVNKRDYKFHTTQAPKWDPRAKRHTKEGYPAFDSKKEAQEYIAKCNHDTDGKEKIVLG